MKLFIREVAASVAVVVIARLAEKALDKIQFEWELRKLQSEPSPYRTERDTL